MSNKKPASYPKIKAPVKSIKMGRTKKQVIPINVIEMKGMGCHLHCKIKINGIWANMLLDTGCTTSALNKQERDKYKLKHIIYEDNSAFGVGTSNLSQTIYKDVKYEFGKIKIVKSFINLLDVDNFNVLYKQFGMPKVDGIIGSDILVTLNAVIYLPAKKLIVKSADLDLTPTIKYMQQLIMEYKNRNTNNTPIPTSESQA